VQPLISIVIPTRNSANTLNSCLQSIVNQTYPNTELVIADSQSTDRTIEIVIQSAQSIALRVLKIVPFLAGLAIGRTIPYTK
jgi:glycosyltransferase involved in cell wall biosynthesis